MNLIKLMCIPVLLLMGQAQAANFFNDRVSVQGFLKVSGTALNDTTGFPMKFVIKKNGVAVWCQSSASNVPVVNGVFSKTLSGASNCNSLVNTLSPAEFVHSANSDVFTVDVAVDLARDGFGSADDASFSGIEFVSTPIAILANQANSAVSVSGIVDVANGGTGASTASAARSNLGLGSLAVLTESGVATDVLRGDGTFGAYTGTVNILGDVTGTSGASTVAKIRGINVSSTAPTAGQVLTFNAGTNSWEPSSSAATVTSVNGRSGAVTLISSDITDATAVNTANMLVKRDASGNFSANLITANLNGSAANVYGTVAIANGGTGAVTSGAARTNLGLSSLAVLAPSGSVTDVLRGNGTFGPVSGTINLSGDVSGTNSVTSVDKIKGVPVSAMAPTGNQTLNYNALTSMWEPVSAVNSVAGKVGAVTLVSADISDATSNNTGDMVVRRDLLGNFSAGTITANLNGSATSVSGIVGIANGGTGASNSSSARTNLGLSSLAVLAPSGVATDVLRGNGTFGPMAGSLSMGGDISGTTAAATVAKIRGVAVSATLPTSNQILSYNGLTSTWEPTTGMVSVAGKTGVVTLQSADITDATNLNTASMLVKRDASGNFSAGTITATLSGNATNVTGTVAVANGGTGATTSAAARSSLGLGALATLATSGVSTDVLRGDGTFGPMTGSMSLAGDVTGTSAASSVTKIRGIAVSATAPTANQIMTYNNARTSCEPKTVVNSVAGRTGAITLTGADITDATSLNTASKIVARDASGNFSAGTITATLSGNATNVTGIVAVANGGTGSANSAAARTALGVAASGANTDITTMTGTASASNISLAQTSGGTTTAYTLTLSPAPAAYVAGQVINLKINATNTGAATLNLNGLGAKNIFSNLTGAAVAAGDLVINKYIQMTYDGTQFLANIPPLGFSATALNCGASIAAGSFLTCPNITATGVNAGDIVTCSPAADPGTTAGTVTWSALATAGNISIRLSCSNAATACALTSRNWKCAVQK